MSNIVHVDDYEKQTLHPNLEGAILSKFTMQIPVLFPLENYMIRPDPGEWFCKGVYAPSIGQYSYHW